MIQDRSHWLWNLLGTVLLLVLAQPVWASEDNEQSWIILERGRPQEAQARCAFQNDFLSRWIFSVAEIRMSAEPSANNLVGASARAFEQGEFQVAASLLQPMQDEAVTSADQLFIRLALGACLVELNRFAEAETMLSLAIDQATSEKRLASRCFGQLHRGRARGYLQQTDAAQEDLQATIKLSRRLGTHRWAAMAALAMSDISRLDENQDDVLYWLEAGLQYYRHGGHLQGQIQALQLLGEALLAMGETEDGLLYLEESRVLAQADP